MGQNLSVPDPTNSFALLLQQDQAAGIPIDAEMSAEPDERLGSRRRRGTSQSVARFRLFLVSRCRNVGRLVLRRLMFVDRPRRWPRCRRQIRTRRNGLISSSQVKSKGLLCQQDNSCHCQIETSGYSGLFLPMDIWRCIHSLMPLRDAARVACVCRAFLCSWRTRSNLTFSNEILGLSKIACGKDETARDYSSIVDQVLKKRLSNNLKTLKLLDAPNHNAWYHRYLDSWLQSAVTPELEELTLQPTESFTGKKKYKFPMSILSHGNAESLRYLSLEECGFHPTVGFGLCFRSLTRLDMFLVYIKGDELTYLLSSTLALESLDLNCCFEIVCLKIPCLKQLTHLSVYGCCKLQAIKSTAPNLSSFRFGSSQHVQLSIGEALQVNKLYIDSENFICYSHAELASRTQNLETLGVHSRSGMVKTPLVSSKLVHLKFLSITLEGLTFDQGLDNFSLTSLSLEAFVSEVSRQIMDHPNYDEIRYYRRASTWVSQACHVLSAWLS